MLFSCFVLLLAFDFLSAGRVPQPEERIIGGSPIEIEQAPGRFPYNFKESIYVAAPFTAKIL